MWQEALAAVRLRLYALLIASKHPQVPRHCRYLMLVVLAYALSPLDLIPDFIPIIGLLDDLVILPLGIWLAVQLMPRQVWQACLAEAASQPAHLPVSRVGIALVLAIWFATAVFCARLYYH